MLPSDHPLTGYDFVAAVDRIKLCLRLSRSTQAHKLHDHLPAHWKASYVETLNGSSSKTDTAFTFWVQDPAGPAQLARDLHELSRLHPLSGDPEILGIEVAIDLYRVSDAAPLDLAAAAHYLIRHHGRPPEGARLITWRDDYPSGKRVPRFKAAAQPREVREHLHQGHTVQLGTLSAEDRARYYVKRHDHVGGQAYAELPPDRHRARMERTLVGSRVPFRSLEGWAAYDFAKLAKLFSLRSRSARARTSTRDGVEPWRHIGLAVDEKQRAAHRRTTADGTQADIESYEVIRNALRRLTRQQDRCDRAVQRASPVQGEAGIRAGIGVPTTSLPREDVTTEVKSLIPLGEQDQQGAGSHGDSSSQTSSPPGPDRVDDPAGLDRVLEADRQQVTLTDLHDSLPDPADLLPPIRIDGDGGPSSDVSPGRSALRIRRRWCGLTSGRIDGDPSAERNQSGLAWSTQPSPSLGAATVP